VSLNSNSVNDNVNYNFKIKKNSQGLYRVEFLDSYYRRYLMDSDFMTSMASSHKSEPVTYSSQQKAEEGIQKFLNFKKMIKQILDVVTKPTITDDFEDV
jgi:uncharacterized protein YegP (UPF0339 family)